MNITTIRESVWTHLVGANNNFRDYIAQSIQVLINPPTFDIVYKLFFNEAPMFLPEYATTKTTFPYVVFDILPITTERDSASKFYSFIVQFRIAALTQEDAENIMNELVSLIEDSESTFTFTDYSVIRIDKQPVIALGKIQNVFNIVVPYLFNIEQ